MWKGYTFLVGLPKLLKGALQVACQFISVITIKIAIATENTVLKNSAIFNLNVFYFNI